MSVKCPRIVFVAEKDAIEMLVPSDWLVISIIDPGRKQVDFENCFGKVLRLEFHDVEEDLGRFCAMSSSQASEVVHYLQEGKKDHNLSGILIHCYAGVSRSAAVAVFAANFFGTCPEGNSEGRNLGVLRRLRRAAAIQFFKTPNVFLFRAATRN